MANTNQEASFSLNVLIFLLNLRILWIFFQIMLPCIQENVYLENFLPQSKTIVHKDKVDVCVYYRSFVVG